MSPLSPLQKMRILRGKEPVHFAYEPHPSLPCSLPESGDKTDARHKFPILK